MKRLLREQPDLMPYYPKPRAVQRGIDLKWGKQQITKAVTQGILQGKSVWQIAADLQARVAEMNRTSAVRAARTAVTGAQNGGRMDAFLSARRRGIALQKEWVATLDSRTRHTHRRLDGEVVDYDSRYDTDPQGRAAGYGKRGGDTYVTIHSPVAVDAVQAAREWRKTTQRLAMSL